MAVLVFLYEPDLFFSSRIESAGKRFRLEVKTMLTINALEVALKGGLPRLLLVNLDVLGTPRIIDRACFAGKL